MKYLIPFLFLGYSVFGQFNDCFVNLYIDKPLVKSDTEAIVANKISKIKLYKKTFGDTILKKILVGEWILKIEQGKITMTTWKAAADSTFFKDAYSYILLGCDPLLKRTYKKDKIIDILGVADSEKLQFIHFISETGRIYKTTCGTSKYESRYEFDKIEYVYDGNLMIEANYNSPRLLVGYNPYLRLLYEYEK